jgi:hypothetical protein
MIKATTTPFIPATWPPQTVESTSDTFIGAHHCAPISITAEEEEASQRGF